MQFSELLRVEGLGVTPSETLDMVEAISQVGMVRLADFHDALRTTLVKRAEDYERFESMFTRFWLKSRGRVKPNPLGSLSLPKVANSANAKQSNPLGKGRIAGGSLFQSRAPDATSADKLVAIYSPLELQSRKNFGELHVLPDRLLLKRGLKSFARAMATLPGRRYAPSTGKDLDFQRTLRSSLKTGGQGIEMEFRSKKISKSRIVVLADISGSMDIYTQRILKLVYHLSNTIQRSMIFGFSTKVVPLNRYLQGKSLNEASDLISRNVEIWSSGTRIGAAFQELIAKYPGVLRSSTIFVVISDGWELGDLETFRRSLRQIRCFVRKIIWLNPQADSPDFQPLAEGMKVALPLIDIFAGLDIFSDRKKFKATFGTTPLSPDKGKYEIGH